MTVFGDWHSITIADAAHSEAERRYLILGCPLASKSLLFPTRNGVKISASSVRDGRMLESAANMANRPKDSSELLPQYDFSGGVRGKYAKRYAQGAKVVVLAPDVAEIFPDSVSVNEALRTLVRLSGKTVTAKARAKKRAG